jgi:hypothetical protein
MGLILVSPRFFKVSWALKLGLKPSDNGLFEYLIDFVRTHKILLTDHCPSVILILICVNTQIRRKS